MLRYTACFDMDDEGNFRLTLVDKMDVHRIREFEGASYAAVLTKAFSFMMRELKNRNEN